jgi:hypothetical protein
MGAANGTTARNRKAMVRRSEGSARNRKSRDGGSYNQKKSKMMKESKGTTKKNWKTQGQRTVQRQETRKRLMALGVSGIPCAGC